MKAISLFSCGGIGDLALRSAGIEVIVANEIISERAEVFKYNFPEVDMIIGDIHKKKNEIIEKTLNILSKRKLDIVFATPPCQGMSKNGQGKLLNLIRSGQRDKTDPRNLLIIPTIDIFKALDADTLVMENVPEMERTVIPDPSEAGTLITIIGYIKRELGPTYESSIKVVEFADYGVPQRRQRLISIFTRNKDLIRYLHISGSLFPPITHSKDGNIGKKWITVRDAISNTPPLDAKDTTHAQCNSIPYHRVPLLDADKYFWVSNTPTGKSAFDNQCTNPSCMFSENPTHSTARDRSGINRASRTTPINCVRCGSLLPRPWVKTGEEFRIMSGYTSAYKRMNWDSPASTLTRNLSYACSDNKIHPDQNRVLSLYEAMILHTVLSYQFSWKRPNGKKVSDKLIRELIGESIPPKGLEKVFEFIRMIVDNEITQSEFPNKAQRELAFNVENS